MEKKKIIHQKVVYGSGLLELVLGYISFVYYLLNLKCGFFFGEPLKVLPICGDSNRAVDALTRILPGKKKFHVFFLFSFCKVAESQKKAETYLDISDRGYNGLSCTLNSIFLLCIGRRRTPSFPPRR